MRERRVKRQVIISGETKLETNDLSLSVNSFSSVLTKQEESNETIIGIPEAVQLPTACAVTIENARHLFRFSEVARKFSSIKIDYEILVLGSHKTPP